jgi:hypothetical protein
MCLLKDPVVAVITQFGCQYWAFFLAPPIQLPGVFECEKDLDRALQILVSPLNDLPAPLVAYISNSVADGHVTLPPPLCACRV